MRGERGAARPACASLRTEWGGCRRAPSPRTSRLTHTRTLFPFSLARLTVVLTPDRSAWVGLPGPLIARLLEGGAPLPLVLRVTAVAAGVCVCVCVCVCVRWWEEGER